MKSIRCSLFLSLLAVIDMVRSEENYGNVDFCGGTKQSPIDLRTKDLQEKYYKRDLTWSKEYEHIPLRMIATGGGSLTIGTEYKGGEIPYVHGGPLPMPYKLSQFHFHWGQNDAIGAEHLINGHRYIMEMHAVHIKQNLTFAEAVLDKKGIAVIAYLFDYSSSANSAMTRLINSFRTIKTTNRTAPVPISRPFRINQLLRPISCDYVTYRGSLTTRPCAENVRWIVSPYLNTLSRSQMSEFRSLAKRGGVETNNYRNLQKRNGRTILYATRNPTTPNHDEYENDDVEYGYDDIPQDSQYF